MSALEYVAWGLAALLAIPLLVNPAGWPVALALGGVIVGSYYVGSYVLDLEKQRRAGERSTLHEIRDRGGR